MPPTVSSVSTSAWASLPNGWASANSAGSTTSCRDASPAFPSASTNCPAGDDLHGPALHERGYPFRRVDHRVRQRRRRAHLQARKHSQHQVHRPHRRVGKGPVHQQQRLREWRETPVPHHPEDREEAEGLQHLLRHVRKGRGGHEDDRRAERSHCAGSAGRDCQGLKDDAMKDTDIIHKFVTNNTKEILALIEELGLSLLSTTQEQSTN